MRKMQRNQNKNYYISIFLWLVLAFPSTFNFLHHFESHDHVECHENQVHIHEYSPECETCDYNMLSFNYDLQFFYELKKINISKSISSDYLYLHFYSLDTNNKQLRAPPFFS